jgi:hypothetical protein
LKIINPRFIAGLDNAQLEHQPSFSQSTADLITAFLRHQPAPVCLVAHNGNAFDIPVLKNAFEKVGKTIPPEVYCADSLVAFRAFPGDFGSQTDNPREATPRKATSCTITPPATPEQGVVASHVQRQLFASGAASSPTAPTQGTKRTSFALGAVYRRIFATDLKEAHSAEGDCVALVKLFHHTPAQLLQWVDQNSSPV